MANMAESNSISPEVSSTLIGVSDTAVSAWVERNPAVCDFWKPGENLRRRTGRLARDVRHYWSTQTTLVPWYYAREAMFCWPGFVPKRERHHWWWDRGQLVLVTDLADTVVVTVILLTTAQRQVLRMMPTSNLRLAASR